MRPLMERQTKQESDARQGAWVNRYLNRIQPMGEGENLEDYLCSWETYLNQEEVPDIH